MSNRRRPRARRSWKVVGATDHPSSVEQLQLDLAAVNRCISALEEADADPQDIEVLATHALTLAERVDEMRWSNPAKALEWLLENEAGSAAALKVSGAR